MCFALKGGTGGHMCWPTRSSAETFGRKNPTGLWISWLEGPVTLPPCGIRGCCKQPCSEGRTCWTCQTFQHGGSLPPSKAVHWQWSDDRLGGLGGLENQWGWSSSRRCSRSWGIDSMTKNSRCKFFSSSGWVQMSIGWQHTWKSVGSKYEMQMDQVVNLWIHATTTWKQRFSVALTIFFVWFSSAESGGSYFLLVPKLTW